MLKVFIGFVLIVGAGAFAFIQLSVGDMQESERTVSVPVVTERQLAGETVAHFGLRLQAVFLLAEEETLKASIVEEYGEYVTPELLARWVGEPPSAPGRLASSPRPDRIEISDIQGDGEGYLVSGFIVHMASDGETERVPVGLRVVQYKGDWLIDSFTLQDSVFNDVPFSAQAPFGNWSDPRQNYACEETSALMAVSWARGETFSLQEAENIIVSTSDWQLKEYGEFHDTSVADTVSRLFKKYFDYHNIEIREDVTAESIKQALWEGNIVLVPIRGQEVGNPYYTQPGPLIHMVVVTGYDRETREFITNDPGTRRGESLRYAEEVLANAVQDYQTGFNESLIEVPSKVMIVVAPQEV